MCAPWRSPGPIHTPWGLSTYRGLLTYSKWPPPLILKADLCRLWHQGSFDFREREHCQHPCKGGEWTPLPHFTMFLEHLSPTSLTLSVQSACRLVVGNHSPWRNGRKGPFVCLVPAFLWYLKRSCSWWIRFTCDESFTDNTFFSTKCYL